MGVPPAHTMAGKLLRQSATPAGQIVREGDARDAAAKAEEDRQRAAIANAPDLTEMVIRANRNLKALKGRSILSASSSLSSEAASIGDK